MALKMVSKFCYTSGKSRKKIPNDQLAKNGFNIFFYEGFGEVVFHYAVPAGLTNIPFIDRAAQNVDLGFVFIGIKAIQKIPTSHFRHVQIQKQVIGFNRIDFLKRSLCTVIFIKLTRLLHISRNKLFSNENTDWIVVY